MLARVMSIGLLALATACSGEPSAERAEAQPSAPAKPTAAPANPPAKSSPSTPASAEGPAELGKPAPDFSLVDTDGKTVKLSSLRGKTVVLEWFNPDCPFVKHAHGSGRSRTSPSACRTTSSSG